MYRTFGTACRALRPGAIAIFALSLAGCANWSSVYRNQTVVDTSGGRQSIVITDAKQRAIHYIQHGSGANAKLKLCAEQAPDIFSVLTATASGELSVKPEQKELAAKAAAALAESGGAIERSQTVNILAMSMYRTCERFLNGEIGRTELSWQAARDQRVMISVLAIEQLTNLIRPQIRQSSTLSAGTVGAAAAAYTEQLAAARAKWEAADKAKNTAQTAHVAALAAAQLPAGKGCSDIQKEPDKDACAAKEDTLQQAKATATDTRRYYEAILEKNDAIQMAVKGAIASQDKSTSVFPTIDPTTVSIISQTVYKIAVLGSTIDYKMEGCLNARAKWLDRAENTNSELFQRLREDLNSSCNEGAANTANETLNKPTEDKNLTGIATGDGTSSIAPIKIAAEKLFIYPQVATDTQRESLDSLLKANSKGISNTIFYRTEKIPGYTGGNFLRYFQLDDKVNCDNVNKFLNAIINTKISCIHVRGYESKVSLGQMEVWLGPETVIPKK
ncbi:hypothetical protein LJR038_005227 [Acidovorax sp. LjRoot38]|uniref:hypothetical protein n=1 Tax=Acidovorax sp. LjRoot38 TaxID=3342327 RepID=UPI003ECEFAB4